MSKPVRILRYVSVWLAFTGACGYFGTWWPIRSAQPQDIWAGDGIGILLFGSVGLAVGGVVGVVGLVTFAIVRSRRSAAAEQAVPGDAAAS